MPTLMSKTRINPHNMSGAGLDVWINHETGKVSMRLVANPAIKFSMSPEAATMLADFIYANCQGDGFYLAG